MAAAALLLSGMGLLVVPGAGAEEIADNNGCAVHSNNVKDGNGDQNGNGDKAGTGNGDDKGSSSSCGDGDGQGNGSDDDGGGTTGPTGPTGAGSTITTAASGVTTTAPSGVQQIKGASSSKGKSKACTSRRLFVIHIRHPHGQWLVAANVTVNGKRVSTMRGSRLSSTIRLVGLPKGTVKVHIRAVTNKGKVLHGTRTYHTCVTGHHGSIPKL